MVYITSVTTETVTKTESTDTDQENREMTEIHCKPPDNSDDKCVTWDPDTIDNEHLNRKSSKSCCIFTGKKRCKHKKDPNDDSDTDSSDSDVDHGEQCS